MVSDVSLLPATEVLRGYRSGDLSPVDVTEAALARIRDLDPRVNAFVLVDEEGAMKAARASDERWRRGEPAGDLDGVPVGIKDIFLTRGWPTRKGSRTQADAGPDREDAPAVARLREAGAVFLGKTTTPELGWKGVTDSPLEGVTTNPWDTALTAGGSSGGSAAAVALGMSPLALGTDGGGSVRIPAGFCGTYGIKPTYGRIPLWPASPFGTLAHVGPLTRTVPDAALMMDVLARPDSRDWSAAECAARSFTEDLDDGVRGLRIAYAPTLAGTEVDPDVASAVADAARAFEELGAHVEESDPGIDDPVEAFETLWYAGAAKALAHLGDEDRALLEPPLAESAAWGARVSAVEYLDAVAVRAELGRTMGAFHQRYDLLLTPALPIPPFEGGREVPAGWPHRRWTSWSPFSYPFNMTQQPAASLPCGFTRAGLPVGAQLVGPKFADALVLRASHAFQTVREAPVPPLARAE